MLLVTYHDGFILGLSTLVNGASKEQIFTMASGVLLKLSRSKMKLEA